MNAGTSYPSSVAGPLVPDFADDLDRANHAVLLAAGYRWLSHNLERHLPGSKTLYEKRCRDHEAEGDRVDKCLLHLYRYDMRPYRQHAGLDPVSYQAEIYLYTREGIALRAEMFCFGADRLGELLPTLERLMLSLWDTYSRKVE